MSYIKGLCLIVSFTWPNYLRKDLQWQQGVPFPILLQECSRYQGHNWAMFVTNQTATSSQTCANLRCDDIGLFELLPILSHFSKFIWKIYCYRCPLYRLWPSSIFSTLGPNESDLKVEVVWEIQRKNKAGSKWMINKTEVTERLSWVVAWHQRWGGAQKSNLLLWLIHFSLCGWVSFTVNSHHMVSRLCFVKQSFTEFNQATKQWFPDSHTTSSSGKELVMFLCLYTGVCIWVCNPFYF